MKKILRRTRRTAKLPGILALALALPGVAGGCPDFRNAVVDAVDTATRGLIFETTSPEAAIVSAAQSIINAALDLVFDQLRAETTR